MGNKLVEIYEHVRQKYGKIGVYRLVVKSRISESAARVMEDTPENIAKLHSIADELGLTVSTEVVSKRRSLISRLLGRRK